MDDVAFQQNERIQDAVIRHLEILGEASNSSQKHYPDFAAKSPELTLAFVYQMQNAIAHGYFRGDYELVWKTIQSNLPVLHWQVRHMVASLD